MQLFWKCFINFKDLQLFQNLARKLRFIIKLGLEYF
jgi:hypothetical protein